MLAGCLSRSGIDGLDGVSVSGQDGLALEFEGRSQLATVNGKGCGEYADFFDAFPRSKRLHQSIEVLLNAREDFFIVGTSACAGQGRL